MPAMLQPQSQPRHPSSAFVMAQALPPGSMLDRYRLQEVVHEDEGGIVYRAQDTWLGCQVAVKEHLPRRIARRYGPLKVEARNAELAKTFAATVRAFTEDAEVLHGLSIASLATVSHVWHENNTVYRAMAWLEGETLAERHASRRLPAGEALLGTVLEPLLDSLLALHTQGHLHGRVSADTVFLEADGRVVLLGFRAKPARSSKFAVDGFVPIELIKASTRTSATTPVGPWSDLYSVGALMRLLMTGMQTPPATHRLVKDECQPLASMDHLGHRPEVLSAIDWALTVLPEGRPRDTAQFRKRLRGPVSNDNRQQKIPPAPRPYEAPEVPPEFVPTRPMVYDEKAVRTRPRAEPPVLDSGAWTLPLPPPAEANPWKQGPKAPRPAHARGGPRLRVVPAESPDPQNANTKPPQPSAASPVLASKVTHAADVSAAPVSKPLNRRVRWAIATAVALGLSAALLGSWWLLDPWLRPPFESIPIATRASAKPIPSAVSTPPPLQAAAQPSQPAAGVVVASTSPPPEAAAEPSLVFDLPQTRRHDPQTPAKGTRAPTAQPANPAASTSRSPPPRPASPHRLATAAISRIAVDTPARAVRNCGEMLSRQSLGVPNAKIPSNPECR